MSWKVFQCQYLPSALHIDYNFILPFPPDSKLPKLNSEKVTEDIDICEITAADHQIFNHVLS